jgi:hypothetical protein
MADEDQQTNEAADEKPEAPPEDAAPKAKKGSGRGGNGRAKEAASLAPVAPPRMKLRYRQEIAPALMQEFGYQNVMAVPRITKVVLNIGLGEATESASVLDTAADEVGVITGQKAVITRAKRPIASLRFAKLAEKDIRPVLSHQPAPAKRVGAKPGLHRRHAHRACRDLAPLDEQLADRAVGMPVLAGIAEPHLGAVAQMHEARALHLHVEQLDRVIEIEQLEPLALERTLLDLLPRQRRMNPLHIFHVILPSARNGL